MTRWFRQSRLFVFDEDGEWVLWRELGVPNFRKPCPTGPDLVGWRVSPTISATPPRRLNEGQSPVSAPALWVSDFPYVRPTRSSSMSPSSSTTYSGACQLAGFANRPRQPRPIQRQFAADSPTKTIRTFSMTSTEYTDGLTEAGLDALGEPRRAGKVGSSQLSSELAPLGTPNFRCNELGTTQRLPPSKPIHPPSESGEAIRYRGWQKLTTTEATASRSPQRPLSAATRPRSRSAQRGPSGCRLPSPRRSGNETPSRARLDQVARRKPMRREFRPAAADLATGHQFSIRIAVVFSGASGSGCLHHHRQSVRRCAE